MRPITNSKTIRVFRELAMFALSSVLLEPKTLAEPSHSTLTSVFSPESTPAKSIFDLSIFVLSITGIIFVIVFILLVYSISKFRANSANANREPAQVYGSTQIELAWTIIPILIVVVLFLATARVIHAVQDAPEPAGAVQVTAIGHQYWWEFRYPKLGIVTANELHIPVSDPSHPTPTFLQLLSVDTDHSFWIPELAGKTDLVPNHPNKMWMDPQRTGIFLGQCAQYCGTQHAKMLLRFAANNNPRFRSQALWRGGRSSNTLPASTATRFLEVQPMDASAPT
jgi:cytochrome c oxidase subunit 2